MESATPEGPGRAGAWVRACLWAWLWAALSFVSGPAIAGSFFTRDLACEARHAGRARELCAALEGALEWGWTGHGILSPGYRMGTDGLREVYCTLPVTPDDSWTLVGLILATETGDARAAQLNVGATGLLSLLGQRALDALSAGAPPPGLDPRRVGHVVEALRIAIAPESTSIFRPDHPAHLLRGGCVPDGG